MRGILPGQLIGVIITGLRLLHNKQNVSLILVNSSDVFLDCQRPGSDKQPFYDSVCPSTGKAPY